MMLILLAGIGGLFLYLVVHHLFRAIFTRSPRLPTKGLPEKHDESHLSPEKQEKKEEYEFPDIQSRAHHEDREVVEQMKRDKELYHKLQNLEDHPAVDEAERRLIDLFDLAISEALSLPSDTILSIPEYDPKSVQSFLNTAHQATMKRYESYIQRRRSKRPRELFRDQSYAKEWLKYAALVKYVDGGWIGSIVNSLPVSDRKPSSKDSSLERKCGKIAWQVISEEFGDGDLSKNHVYLYEKLVSSLKIGKHDTKTSHLGYEKGFDGTGAEEGVPNCWTAAIAQQTIGLLSTPEDYFPEALGFNMAYETLPYHLLVTSYELRELGMDDYYFNIHITIDNPSTGHSAMARIAVEKYIEGVKQRDGQEAADRAWKRVQAGFILAEGLPTTPTKPRDFSTTCSNQPISSVSQPTASFANLIISKAASSNKIHCASRLKLGGKTVDEWLDTEKAPMSFERAVDFATALSEKKGWVIPGNPVDSRLVKELEWGGRMFGAFSRTEVEIVRSWVKSLSRPLKEDSTGTYNRYIDPTPISPSTPPPPYSSISRVDTTSPLIPLMPIWFLSLTLLDRFQLSPSRFASPIGMIVLRIQRAQSGFIPLHLPSDLCEGNDQVETLGFENGLWEMGTKIWTRMTGTPVSRDVRSVIKDSTPIRLETIDEILDLRLKPYASLAKLLGLVEGFTTLLNSSLIVEMIDSGDKDILNRIIRDQVGALGDWKEEIASGEDMDCFEQGRRMALDLVGQAASG